MLIPLKFPNARLHIHNLLRNEKVSGAEAIALIAIEYGLVDTEFIHRIEDTQITNGNCSCLQSAKKILSNYFEQRKAESLADVNVSQVWSSFQGEIQAYLRSQQRSSVPGNGNGNGISSLNSSEAQTSLSEVSTNIEVGHDCTKFAPAVFDLLLQQIRRYP